MFEEIRNSFRNGNILQRIIILNVGLFVVQSLIFLLFTIGGGRDTFSQVLSYLYFPESPAMLLRRPWTLFTYQFLHDPFGLFHILFNMLYLWWFGRIAVEFIRERYILPLYSADGSGNNDHGNRGPRHRPCRGRQLKAPPLALFPVPFCLFPIPEKPACCCRSSCSAWYGRVAGALPCSDE